MKQRSEDQVAHLRGITRSKLPHFAGLLDPFFDHLSQFDQKFVTNTWLARAIPAAEVSDAIATFLGHIESAASHSRQSQAMANRLRGTLPKRPTTNSAHKPNQRFVDALVELCALSWLRNQYPDADILLLEANRSPSPDIAIVDAAGKRTCVECKNIRSSDEVDAAFRRGDIVSGCVPSYPHAFVRKLRDTLARAARQIHGCPQKMIFLNYVPDPDVWVLDEENPQLINEIFRECTPSGTTLVVFRFFDWTSPRYRS